MTRITKPKRGRRPTKRLELTDIRHALRDTRQWTALGVVIQPEDGGEHWEIVGDNADVMIEVELQPTQEVAIARLAAGMWIVPDVGDEVAVILPAGELDFMPVITCILSHALPTAQGPARNRIVIVRGEVLVHDGAGGAEELALKRDVDNLAQYVKDQFDPVTGHTHKAVVPAQPSSVLPSTTPSEGATGTPDAVGTSVLKAK